MIETGGTAPYAPGPATIEVITAYRNKPVPTPLTKEVIERIGVSASIAPRTLQALRLLDLIDDDGNPTAAFDGLRRASTEEYKERLAEVVRGAYSEIFAYRDPATDTAEQITDAFRAYTPHGMRSRMARLYLALCVEAGIIAAAPTVARGDSAGERSKRPKAQRAPVSDQAPKPSPQITDQLFGPAGRQNARANREAQISAEDHLVIRGLMQTLPPVGTVFPEPKRRAWTDAVLAAFALIYEREPDSEGGEDD